MGCCQDYFSSCWVQIVTTCLHIVTGYLLILHWELGVAGAATALSLSHAMNFVALTVLLVMGKTKVPTATVFLPD